MDVSMMLPPEEGMSWDLARQIGVTHAVSQPSKLDPGPSRDNEASEKGWDYESLLHLKSRFEDAGFELTVIEDRPPMDRIRLGKPGREQELDRVCQLIRTMGALDIPIWCWTWMAKFSWYRTSTNIPARGGSLVSAYDHELMANAPYTDAGTVSDEQLWDSLEYFLQRVVPVAEEAGVKLALHPDDPPLPSVRGVSRIFRNVDAFDRMLSLYPSDHNGITFCQGNFAAMGVDIPDAIRHFDDDIHFAHFRDVRGTAEKFVETWHDEGPTDMRAAMEAYEEIDFDGPIRPDHVPTMAGESNDVPGYETKGKLFAIGYMKGLME